ncbi:MULTISPECIES: crotonase/enoyl-CoA hydratase family protein [unclassified Afipia]|uniref:crotonase/enoyl-CoA hydratase family protein n=1 Tax=unclassified Afipia TaxID=2642050 RepID=UPI0004178E20|nr:MULTISPECIES: crotonase/enoyl-CoA hydratase family protein [unclassified Afipia]
MTDHVIVTDEDSARIITMRRPDKKNALTQGMYIAMADAIKSAQNDPDIRSIVISGGSGVFTASNDLEDFAKANTANDDSSRPMAATQFLKALAYNEKPLIGAVDGIAVGVGTTMLFHCDYVLASTTATFSTPFIHLGLVPEAASSLLAPRVMGHQRAFSMLVMGRTVTAEEAREAGFVNVIVAPGHTEVEARKIAREIGSLPKDAVALTRKLLKPAREDVLRRMDEESHHFGERLKSDEARNAFSAFFSRKKKA